VDESRKGPAATWRSEPGAPPLDERPPSALVPTLAVAMVVVGVLVGVSGRYGYHRDELYFLACGRHLAWGYPDQPPLVPALARAMSAISSTSVSVLRIPSEVATAATVLITGNMARELGAERAGQLLAAVSIGVSSILLETGHYLSTTTFLLTFWAALVLVALRALRSGDSRWWLAFGLLTGLGLQDSDLVALLALAIVAAVAVLGPRRSLLSPWAIAGFVLAASLWSPYLVWQAVHGWPELQVARAIAEGRSGTSAPRWQVIALQFVLCSPPLVPIWIAGLVRLFRDRRLRWARALGLTYLLLLAAFLVTSGKPYYLAGMFPLLLAAGAAPTVRWAQGVGRRARRHNLWAALVVAAAADAVITLPVLPSGVLHSTPIVAMNYDVGETLGWPGYVREIAAAYRSIPSTSRARAIILTRNYGEAGAIERYGSAFGLPHVYSGHNGYWLWGPPPGEVTTVVAVGLQPDLLVRAFAAVRPAGRLENYLNVDDDEEGVGLEIASGPKESWRALWPELRRYG
jgi:4-amino-4-deoxy-L-arabinose transferase-like glycosyltransferase